MNHLLAIASGGAIGAVGRYLMSNGVYAILGRSFPYGTLAVNVLGSLLMGILYILLLERVSLSMEWRAALQIGLLGAFTTFSTFSIETLLLIENGELSRAAVNIILSVVLCLAAVWAGVLIGRQI
ncbi:MAG TPA: fluoride efflux transporter CrcB [Gammaproteobacteria bacterium]|nr:fluoride efflux transporter CrcB [Gammaproteobacteria bacterium]